MNLSAINEISKLVERRDHLIKVLEALKKDPIIYKVGDKLELVPTKVAEEKLRASLQQDGLNQLANVDKQLVELGVDPYA